MPTANAIAIARQVCELVFGETLSDAVVKSYAKQMDQESLIPFDLLQRAFLSKQGQVCSEARILQNHGHFIHSARVTAIRNFLPAAAIILDLGGANAPLYEMGYSHQFEKLTLIDLPAENRHALYTEIIVRPFSEGGEVVVQYSDMTNLAGFEDGSVDLVWSGQSIEHVPEDAALKMVAESYRVLRPGGIFALDTPNGLITSLHAFTAGLKVIHPEHFIEYTPERLMQIIQAAGFRIEMSFGTNHMPQTSRSGVFNYADFVYGVPTSQDVRACYSQFHIARKPD